MRSVAVVPEFVATKPAPTSRPAAVGMFVVISAPIGVNVGYRVALDASIEALRSGTPVLASMLARGDSTARVVEPLVALQCEYHPTLSQHRLLAEARRHGLALAAHPGLDRRIHLPEHRDRRVDAAYPQNQM